ncbi:uncharacterized protein PFL1_06508 [Pseudozyma flocculosa PF-1]|uniref:CipC-like antibiotic response protein n=2 Tax=Pseudozyma flocculosa TaxID=84751 RepID=A0A5C3FBE1_9BASI|nr:uncharacterized protein PFL1_06508 [Pseudozyma flocculosa PF-1]EPQ25833.1 hypothetical protein PFL1_06508 [Pseudozyma flocculosa PF-1]SPO40669.1 uncharacterized protein PSFLO_06151 [Pseudozyma flocculosa]
MWFNDHEEAAEHVYNNDPQGDSNAHEAKWTHEAVGFGAGFVAMREYEKRQEAQGERPKHEFAKEMIAGIAGAEVDKLFETKGLDFLDREKAKHHAREQAERIYDERYQ